MKFGGTSVSEAKFWETISGQAQQRAAEGWHTLIVVSALSGVTDLLSQLAAERKDGKRLAILEDIDSRHTALFAGLGLEPGGVFRQAWADLLALADQYTDRQDVTRQAMLLASGERLSSALGQQVLQRDGIDIHLQDATDLLVADGRDVVALEYSESFADHLAERFGEDPSVTVLWADLGDPSGLPQFTQGDSII